jgi:hypothetical protein
VNAGRLRLQADGQVESLSVLVDRGNVAPLSLSWAGDRTVGFEWTPGNNLHLPGLGYRVLNIEFSVRTGQLRASLAPTPCGGHGERYDHGRLSRITLHPPMYGMNFGADFAWQYDFVNIVY